MMAMQHHGASRVLQHLLLETSEQIVDLALVRTLLALEPLQGGDVEVDT